MMIKRTIRAIRTRRHYNEWESGWWGDQSRVSPADGLRPEYLSAVLQKKCGRSHSELKSPGVYMYLKKGNNMIYIGSAIGNETLLDRQMRHLTAAAYTDMDQLDMFDRQLRQQYAQDNWDFYAIPMSSGNPEKIHDKEKELITQYNAIKHGYNSWQSWQWLNIIKTFYNYIIFVHLLFIAILDHVMHVRHLSHEYCSLANKRARASCSARWHAIDELKPPPIGTSLIYCIGTYRQPQITNCNQMRI